MCFAPQNEAAFDEIFQQANFNTFVFRNRVKLETYNVSKAATAAVIALMRRPAALLSWHHALQYYLNKTKECVCVTAREEEEEEELGEHPSLEIVISSFSRRLLGL